MERISYYHWFTLADQYLRTSKLIMEQIKNCKNKWFMIEDKPIEWDAYFEATKWSDFNTFVPSLFLLEHGIELLLKGIYVWAGNEIIENHKLNDILFTLKKDERISEKFFQILDNYIGDNPKNKMIKEFTKMNKHLATNNLHVALRYPEKHGTETDFAPFRYKEEALLNDIDAITSDIDMIIALTVQLVDNSG